MPPHVKERNERSDLQNGPARDMQVLEKGEYLSSPTRAIWCDRGTVTLTARMASGRQLPSFDIRAGEILPFSVREVIDMSAADEGRIWGLW